LFENRVLRRIFGPKRDEVMGEWRKLNNEEFYNLLYIPGCHYVDGVKANEVGRACGTHGREEKSVQGFGRKPEGNRTLERLRHRWEDGIRMDRDIGWEGRGCGLDSTGSR
jgi:hypothetical protein